jgi:hypothetical protein
MTDRHLSEKRSTREIKDEIGHAQKTTHLQSLPPHHAPRPDQ